MSPWSIPASLTSSTPSTTNPNRLPSRVSSSTSPAALCPKVKLRPDHHGGRVQPLDQHLVGELVGRHPGQLGGERQHAEHVDARARRPARPAGAAWSAAPGGCPAGPPPPGAGRR